MTTSQRRVPCERCEARRDLRVAIADQDLDAVAVQSRRALAAIEQRDAVAARERVFDLVRAEEAGAAEEEDVERLRGAARDPARHPAGSVAVRHAASSPIIASVHFSNSRREVMLSTPCATH